MDLNYAFLRQQVERSLANASSSEAARRAHEELARAYERQIERMSGGRIMFRSPGETEQLAVIVPPTRSASS